MEDDRVARIGEESRSDECIGVLVAACLQITLVETVVRVLQYRGMRTEVLHQLDDAVPS